jgi:hypothetical protein
MQQDTSDSLFSAFENTFVMKGFFCFTDIVIYKQFSCHEFKNKSIIVTNIDNMKNFKFYLIRQFKLDATRHV